MACEKCKPFDGKWMETPAGLRRCDCPEGKRLSQGPVAHPPTLTAQQTTVFVGMLAAIPFFPGEAEARIGIGDDLAAICEGPQQALWLVTRMRRLYNRWPGPMELRRVYAAKHVPWDGVLDAGTSEVYPEGIPSESERPVLALDRPAVRLLPGGQKHEVIEDPARAQAIERAAAKMPRMPSGRPVGGKFEATLRELETAPQDRPELPGPTPQIITAEDVDRAVAELRERKRDDGRYVDTATSGDGRA